MRSETRMDVTKAARELKTSKSVKNLSNGDVFQSFERQSELEEQGETSSMAEEDVDRCHGATKKMC